MRCTGCGWGSKWTSVPFFVVIVSILLEITLLSIHTYIYQFALMSFLVDEIFLGVTSTFLLLSISWFFVSSNEPIYSHFRYVRGIQAVIMIVNGLMFIISTVRTKLSEECVQIEVNVLGIRCQHLELRLFIGSLAISDSILYFFRRPISLKGEVEEEQETDRDKSGQHSFFSFKRNNSGDGGRYKRKIKKNKGDGHEGLVIEIQQDPKSKLFQSQEQLTNDYILKLDLSQHQNQNQRQPPNRQHSIKLKQTVELGTTTARIEQEDNNKLFSNGDDDDEDDGVGGGGHDSLEEIVKRSSAQKSPTGFYFTNQEYFLPRVSSLPSSSKYSQSRQDEQRFSTLSRDFSGFS